ncbi:Cupredoxin [Parachaetomium inaequale]|uniref:Copper-containing nitrite reductase n=1 Tax=Parachaetomium inaequale TaxID=2588326 RepID=A0AAN6SRL2_9PEZI|nr:Cupredoxin [Parachaetomium inaequale]
MFHSAAQITLSQQARRLLQVPNGRRALSSKTNHHTTQRQRVAVQVVSASALGALFLLYPRRPARLDLLPDRTAPKHESEPAERPVFVSPGLKDQDAKSDSRLQFYETLDVESAVDLPSEDAILTQAPYVPPAITRDYPVLLHVPLTTSAKLAQLTNQYQYEQWTFNGTVPGPFIRARVGDVVDLTLTNRDDAGNPHNIDCHAFTGPGGGAALTTAEEGETKSARFKLLHPGLYLYHCAAAPVPVHIANGMYGLMYVQPASDTDGEGGDLPPVDREYYVMQSEFYHEPPEILDDGRPSRVVEFSYPEGLREEPSIVVFNGSESALTRDRPLKATAGETVRIFFGNAGPNLTSSFHVIGSNFKNVYREGDVLSPPGRFVSTVSVPPGGATIVDMKMVVPGTYTLLDHAIFRLDKGAVGFLNVSGKPRPDVYGSSEPPAPCVGCKLHS